MKSGEWKYLVGHSSDEYIKNSQPQGCKEFQLSTFQIPLLNFSLSAKPISYNLQNERTEYDKQIRTIQM